MAVCIVTATLPSVVSMMVKFDLDPETILWIIWIYLFCYLVFLVDCNCTQLYEH